MLRRRVRDLERDAPVPPPPPPAPPDLSHLTPAERARLRALLLSRGGEGLPDLSLLSDDDLAFLERALDPGAGL